MAGEVRMTMLPAQISFGVLKKNASPIRARPRIRKKLLISWSRSNSTLALGLKNSLARVPTSFQRHCEYDSVVPVRDMLLTIIHGPMISYATGLIN